MYIQLSLIYRGLLLIIQITFKEQAKLIQRDHKSEPNTICDGTAL